MEKEIRVYGINQEELKEEFSDAVEIIGWSKIANWEFKEWATEQGNVWSLKGFEEAFNGVEICTDMFVIRII